MGTFIFYDEFKGNIGKKLIDLSADTFKIALSNTAPVLATDDELADITQLSTGGGYTGGAGGGVTPANRSWAETAGASGIWRFTHDDVVITASGGSIGPFRYYAWYSDTSTGDKLVGYMDRGSSLTLADGQSVTLDVGANGIFEMDG